MHKLSKGLILGCAAFGAQPVSTAAIAETVEERILARIDALEKQNASLQKENVALQGRVNRLETSKTPKTSTASAPAERGPVVVKAAPEAEFYDARVVPNWQPHYETSAALLFLQPGGGNLQYGTRVTPFPAPSPNWANQSLSPNYSPAFRIGLRYRPTVSEDIEANWTHLDTNAAHSSFIGDSTQMVGPPFLIGPGANAYKMGQGDVSFAYDSVTLDGGHTFCAECAFQLRVFGGLEVARIGQHLTGGFESYDFSNLSSYTNYSLFTGAGPRLGAKAQYALGNFQFLGEIAGAAIVGKSQGRIDFLTNSAGASPAIPSPNMQSLSSPDATQIVGAIETRLAVSYAFPQTTYGQFKTEIGYQAAVYSNAINQYALTQVATPPVVGTVGVFLATQQHLQNNFTVQGPYVAGRWVF